MNEELKKMNIMMKALIRHTDRLLSVPSWFNVSSSNESFLADVRSGFMLLLLFFLFPVSSFSQSSLRQVTGTVTDAKTGKAVGFVTVKALNANDSLLAYAMTDGRGVFRLTLDSSAEALEFSFMGYDKKRIKAESASTDMKVKLTPSGIMLKELTVKAKPIERRHDTINYNVAAFKDKSDRYIEDVLKKMPGIEVAENGSISYKGTPINKFNIEGQDLLGNQYNQATRNLSADAVATVQVMENDQPIRALQNRVPSDRATLNIKLKPGYKARLFGEVKGGLGGFADVLWNNALTLISIGKKTQVLVNAKMNNSGENLSENTEEHVNSSDLYNYEPLPDEMVQTMSMIMPPIGEKRYLNNKSYSAGANLLNRVGEYGSLRTNVTYFGTSDILQDSTYSFYGGNETLALGESNRSKTVTNNFMPRITYEHNAPNVYFVDEVKGFISSEKHSTDKNFWQDSGNLTADRLSEDTRRHPGYVQNKLSMSINSGANTYSVNSLIRYFRRSETLGVADGDAALSLSQPLTAGLTDAAEGGTYSLDERISLESFMTRNSVSTKFYAGRSSFDISYGFEVHGNHAAVDGGERFGTTYMKHSLTPGYGLIYPRGSFGIDIPVNVFMSKIPWSEAGTKTEVYLSPSVHWRHKFSPFWSMNVIGNLGRDSYSDVLLPVEFFSGYRTRVTTADRVGWTRSKMASLSLSYSNVITMFVWNLIASASWSVRDHYNEYVYGETYTTVRPVWEDVNTRLLYVMTSADKTFYSIGTSLKATLNYNRTQLPVAQNGVNTIITGNIASAALSLNWKKLSWINVNVKPTFNLSWQDRSAYSSRNNMLKTFYNVADIHVFPIHGLDISLSWDYNLLELERGRYSSNSFLDMAAHYVATKRIELRLQVSNIFNRKSYEEASFSGLNYSYYSMPLRGREALLSLYVNI